MYQMRRQKRRKINRGWIFLLATIVLLGIAVTLYSKENKHDAGPVKVSTPAPSIDTSQKMGEIKDFTGKEFSELYNSFAYPNTALIGEESNITGNPDADKQIRELAKNRGYKRRSAPVSDTLRDVGGGMLLQQLAVKPWNEMKSEAEKDGVRMSLIAAYRSAAEQRQIFLNRLGSLPLNLIALGKADAEINNLLRTTAIPGYSRHHTGYTIDIKCDSQPSVTFENSVCFRWLSNNNYSNAKQNGWIPSYPDGAGQQGPDPESWEYVWVGTDSLR